MELEQLCRNTWWGFLINNVLGNVGDIDLDVLWAVKRGAQVEVLNIKEAQFGALLVKETVEKEIE